MLDRDHFARDAETVARDLLGATLCVRGPGPGTDAVVHRLRVVETEAYVGPHDAACHARSRTPRTELLFGEAGRTYVYFVYGMHHLLNVVTGPTGHGEAVLVRAAEPLAPVGGRTDGPARLTKTLGITVQTHNGLDACTPDAPLWYEPGTPPRHVVAGPRVGVDFAGDWAHAPLRFCDPDSKHLSKPAHHPGPAPASVATA